MPKLPQVSGRKTIVAMSKLGYYVDRQKGSHIRLCHPHKKPTTVPDHKVLDKGLLRRILRDAELSVDEFIDLLKK